MTEGASDLAERLAMARQAWPSAMSDGDIVEAAKTGLSIAAAHLQPASDQARTTLWNGYFKYLYGKKASYQFQDFEIADYNLTAAGKLGLLRGPKLSAGTLESGDYICMIGAAQFFGRFAQTSLQEMIAQRFGLPVLNLSFGGAGPQSFLNDEAARLLRKAKLVVVQVMAGRSVGCDEYPGGMSTYRKGTRIAVNREVLLLEIAQQDPEEYARLARKWLGLYVDAYARIGAQTEGRSILVWVSKRRPKDWSIRSGAAENTLGVYPQMVTAKALRAIRSHFTAYVDCTEPKKPIGFVSRFDGQPCPFVATDGTLQRSTWYYPSPEFHRSAFETIVPAMEKLLPRSARP
ncbi:MAG TPA: DUF6473 family protein [Rhizomicrobium sp.]|nr:DUF6473 family protein [Rhizomicrobium sp.]